MQRWAYGAAVLLSACFHPSFDHPACGPGGVCPSGLQCSTQGFCELLGADPGNDAGCDPIQQTGCRANEKCTWIVDTNATIMTAQTGHVACARVDADAVPDGMACNPAMATAAGGGVDNCVAGDICITRVCKKICDPLLASGAGADACDSTHACLSYRGVFDTPTARIAGVCEVRCDPLTQRLATNKAEACGSSDPANPTGTCIPTTGEFKSFACAPVSQDPSDPTKNSLTRTDRMPPLGDSRGFLGNGCAPGFLPFFFEDASGVMKTLCSGMCAPVKMDSTIYAAGMAANPDMNAGDPQALGKLPADMKAVAGHATCQVGVKGSLTQAQGTEDCRYVWAPLAISSNPANPTPVDTPYNNTLGMCFAYSKFKTVDTNNDGTADAFEKSCRDLGTAPDAAFGTAEQNGCYPVAGFPGGPTQIAPLAFKPNQHRVGIFRLAYGVGAVARPVIE